jgi:hypothetical protein
MSDNTSTPTVGAMIDKVKELEAYIALEIAKLTERLAPFQQAVSTLEGAIKQYLIDNKAQNVKS